MENTYKFILSDDNLGVTSLENMFINDYMPRARGDYVKVYIFGLKHCYNTGVKPVDNKALATLFNLTEGDIIAAWDYWKNEGIIDVEYLGTHTVVITYYHIVSKMLVGTKTVSQPPSGEEEQDDERIAGMYTAIQNMYGSRPLTQKDLLTFKDFILRYHFSPETVVLLVEYAMNLINKKTEPFTQRQMTSYMEAVAEAWNLAGVRDYTQAEAYMHKSRQMQKLYYDIMRYQGRKKNLIQWEKELIDSWVNDFGYGYEIIELALARTDKTDLRYIDGILKKWQGKGYKTPADIEAEPKGALVKISAVKNPEDEAREKAYKEAAQADLDWIMAEVQEHKDE